MADDAKDDAKQPVKESTNAGGEIVTLNIGGCGVALGQSLLQQYCAERGIARDGSKKGKSKYDDSVSIQFEESSNHRYKARSMIIDLDPYTINTLKSSFEYKSLFNASYLIAGKHDASNNYTIATVGRGSLIDGIMDEIRNLVNGCDKLQGFVINHSLTGGTGSGFTSLLLERLTRDYGKKCLSLFTVMHDETFLSHPAQVYNGVLAMQSLGEYCDYSVMSDNKALYHIVQQSLQIKTPRFRHYNGLLNKLYSSITAPVRYNVNNYSLWSLQQEMVPLPGLKYLFGSFWPIIPRQQQQAKPVVFKKDVQSLTNQCVQAKNFMVHAPDFDPAEDKFFAMTCYFRGNVDKEKANQALDFVQKEKKFCFAGKATQKQPSVQFHESVPTALPNDDLIELQSQVSMLGNNSCMQRQFSDRLCKVYDLLYSQRAYVHQYVGEGAEEGEFAEARERLGLLEKDYLDALADPSDGNDD